MDYEVDGVRPIEKTWRGQRGCSKRFMGLTTKQQDAIHYKLIQEINEITLYTVSRKKYYIYF